MIGSIVNFLTEMSTLEIALVALFGVLVAFNLFAIPYAIYVLVSMSKSGKKKSKQESQPVAAETARVVLPRADKKEETKEVLPETHDEPETTVEENTTPDVEENNESELTTDESETSDSVEPENTSDESVEAESVVDAEPETLEDEEPIADDNAVVEVAETAEVAENSEPDTVEEEPVAENQEVDDANYEEPTVVEENVESETVVIENTEPEDNAEETNETDLENVEAESETVLDEEPEAVENEEPEVAETAEVVDDNESDTVEEEPVAENQEVDDANDEEPTVVEENVEPETVVIENTESEDNAEETNETDLENVEAEFETVENVPVAVDENALDDNLSGELLSENNVNDETNIESNDANTVDLTRFEPEIVDGFLFFNALRRSFLSKIIQANETTQNYYSELKNKLLSYRRVHNRLSWGAESFRLGRVLKAKMTVRGKTLCLFLALNPDEFNKNIYHQRNFGDKKKYADVPMMLRVRSPLGLKRALTLIEIMLKDVQLDKKFEHVDYHFDYETDDELIAKDLIRRIRMKRFLDVHEDETVDDAVVRIVTESESQVADSEDSGEGEEIVFVDVDDESEDESEDIPDNLKETNEDSVPDFAELSNETTEEVVPESIKEEKKEEILPEFANADDEEETVVIPENIKEESKDEVVDEVPEFVAQDENSVNEPVAHNDEVAPVFVDTEEIDILPETIEEPKDEFVPDFANEDDEGEAVVIPENIKEEKKEEILPDFANADDENETVVIPESINEEPKDEFVPDFVNAEDENESVVIPGKIKEERKPDMKPEFAGVDENDSAIPEKFNVVETKKKDEVAPEWLDNQENDLPPDAFANLPVDEVETKDETVTQKNVPQKFEERPSTLPQGLYDDVPDDRKVVKKEEKQEKKRIIPEGLTKEEQKLIDENQALLDGLMEDSDNVENEEVIEIVGTCEDTSEFNNFEMKLYNASNNLKYYYSEIKNTLLSYKGIKCKQSNAGDSFRQGNNLVSRITLNGNKLRLHLALNPKEYSQNVYNHYSLAHLNAYTDVPFTLEVSKRSDLTVCVKLIQDAMASKFVVYLAKNRQWIDYAAKYTKKQD